MSATFVYDDDCGFCSWWAAFFAERSELGIVGFSELTDEERARLPDDWEDCTHLLTDDAVYSCGAAVEEALLRSESAPWADELLRFLRGFDDYERLRERAYQEGADRRDVWGLLLSDEPPERRTPK